MIKQNQTYLNRLHVLMDALCIYFAGFAAHFVRFNFQFFSFEFNGDLFERNRYYLDFFQYQQPLIGALIILLLFS